MARLNSEESKIATMLQVLEVEGSLKGKTFSITGHLGKPRKEIIEIIEQAGGKYEEKPRWGVNYLVTNSDWNKGSTIGKTSSKYQSAQAIGIKIISEAELYAMITRDDPNNKR